MKPKANVLIIVQNQPVPYDRRVWKEALSLKKAGYGVSVICPKGPKGKLPESYVELEGIHVYRYPAPPEANGTLGYFYEFAYSWIMTAFLSVRVKMRRGFDVIQACNPPETYFLLAWFYRLFGVKFIFDHHDLSPEMYVAKGGRKGGLLHRGLVWMEKLTFRTADAVITTNESHKKIAMDRGGVPAGDIFIVRTGPDLDRLQQQPVEPALKDGRDYLVCYLGEMCPQDGVDYVLKSAEVLQRDFGRDDVKFVLMGGGPSVDELREMSIDMGLDSFVEFTGRVSEEDLCRYLSAADVCLDPDPYTEWSDKSTMTKMMEYMAFAKPIVAFDLTENRFSGSDAAIYTTPNDIHEYTENLVTLLDDEDLRTKMGEFGYERVTSKLLWNYSEPHLEAAYAHALGESPDAS